MWTIFGRVYKNFLGVFVLKWATFCGVQRSQCSETCLLRFKRDIIPMSTGEHSLIPKKFCLNSCSGLVSFFFFSLYNLCDWGF